MIGCQRSEELICHDTITRHLRGGDSWNYPLSGKKNYFWYRDHWNSLYQPKAIYERLFDGVRESDTLGLEWMMWTTLLKTTQGMILLARALKNLSISIFIKVLPTSESRILATHLTTLTNSDGQCRCIERQPFLRFHLSKAKGMKSGWSTERHLALRF